MSTNDYKHHSYLCQTALAPGLIAKHGTADGTCALATAASDALIGTNGTADIDSRVAGEMADLHVGTFGEVRLGAALTRGTPITANAAGKAVAAATGNRIVGFLEQSGAVDDIVRYRVSPGVL